MRIQILALMGALLFIRRDQTADRPVSEKLGADGNFTAPEDSRQTASSSDEFIRAAYSSLLSEDRTLLDAVQLEMWWIPDC